MANVGETITEKAMSWAITGKSVSGYIPDKQRSKRVPGQAEVKK